MQRFSNSTVQMHKSTGTKDRVKLSSMHKKPSSKKLTTSNVVCIDFLKYLFFIVCYLFSLHLYCITITITCQHLSYTAYPYPLGQGRDTAPPTTSTILSMLYVMFVFVVMFVCLLLSLSLSLYLWVRVLVVHMHMPHWLHRVIIKYLKGSQCVCSTTEKTYY